MPSLRKEREAAVQSLTSEFDGIESLIVAGYVGVKTPELNELRGKLKPLKAKCQIVKNRLAKIALKNRGIDDSFAEFFTGQSALIIQKGDAVAGFKVLVDFEKSHENLKIRGGLIGGKVVKPAEIKAMANLPSRKVLLSQLVGRMMGPVQGMHNVLSAHLRNLASVLDQIAKSKEKSGPSA